MEDLWCFNSPQVVQAIYDAQVPVITAIGHETDTTLADYAADVRAATPTHAAELAFPDFEEIQMDLAAMADQAYQSVVQRLDRLERELGRTVAALQTRRYDDFLTMKDESVSQLVRLARQHLDLKLTRETGRLQALKASLSAMNPALLVRKGYGQLEQDGHVLTDIQSLRQDRPLTIQLLEGTILTEIKEVTIHGSDKRKTKNFETNYATLEKLVRDLESPDLTLAQSLELFEKAIKVSQSCESALEYARQRAQVLADMQKGPDTDTLTEEGTLDL